MNDITTNQVIDPQIRQLAFSPARLRTVDDFECDNNIIGEGTYGQVIKARDKRTNEIVALKKMSICQRESGLPITSVREIKLLKSLKHENIVTLKEVILDTPTNKNTNTEAIFLVFEYMEHDLAGLNKLEGDRFTSGQIACYAKQLLEGLYYCHKKKVLHRDIKGANMLVNKEGILKLADFGLAKRMKNSKYTYPVVTLWYRAPELLLGAKTYTPAIDMWSVGCLLVELYTQQPLFPGHTDAEQINKIFAICGTPSDDNWPEGRSLPIFETLKIRYTCKRKLRTYLENKCNGRISKDGIDLLDKLLSLDPTKRPSAENALDHSLFFGKEVSSIEDIPKYSNKTCNELISKQISQPSNRPAARGQPPNKKVRGNNYNNYNNYNHHRSNGHYNNNRYNQNREYRPRNDYNNRGRRGYNGQRRSNGNPEYNPRNVRRGYNNNRYHNRDQRSRYNNHNYNQNNFQKDHQNDTPSSTHAEPPKDYREVEIPTDNETV